MGWWIGAILVWLVSAACIVGTIVEVAIGKSRPFKPDNWGAFAFHGATAILVLWLLTKAMV